MLTGASACFTPLSRLYKSVTCVPFWNSVVSFFSGIPVYRSRLFFTPGMRALIHGGLYPVAAITVLVFTGEHANKIFEHPFKTLGILGQINRPRLMGRPCRRYKVPRVPVAEEGRRISPEHISTTSIRRQQALCCRRPLFRNAKYLQSR